MENIIVILIVAMIVVAAVIYVVRAKKKGAKCIGCPYANGCGENCNKNEK